MSVTSIKRHNHRVHACEKSRKQELLQHLITLYAGKSILVVSAANTTTTQIDDKNLTLSNDDELSKMDDRQWDVLISFDLPKVSQDYLARLEHAKEIALIMIDEKEQTLLYPIETLVGKNLPREVIPGFEIKAPAAKREAYKPAPHRPTESQKREELKATEKKKEGFKKENKPSQRNHRYDGTVKSESDKRNEGKPKFIKDSDQDRKEKKSFGKKEWDKPKGDKKPWDKKDGDKKPWENKSSSNDYRNKKETTHTSSKPQRAPRVIKIPSENKSKES
jgi:superfamily II DNA/RNA helicase